MTKMMNPPENSIFRWSCFCSEHPFVNKTEALAGSEYQSPQEAAAKIVEEDGQLAWDTATPSYPGDIMRKKIFGLYGKFDETWELTAGYWDISRENLVGAATIQDWAWYDIFGYEGDMEFTDENILPVLEEDLSEFLATL
jgi:hypothetical protein